MNPLDGIEQEKAQMDLGVLGFRVWRGALSEGATEAEAFLIVTAFFRAAAEAGRDEC